MDDLWLARGGSYEYRVVSLPPPAPFGAPTSEHRAVAGEIENNRWELARSAVYWGGGKRMWLRRKTLHVEPTLWAG
ncbi:MAG: DUF5703 family protein [Bifidobacteriaceae bacterium]|jgi:hypothetical protein|nr:DUF5703 family protein [Bifidobacteriaceae bacterium]